MSRLMILAFAIFSQTSVAFSEPWWQGSTQRMFDDQRAKNTEYLYKKYKSDPEQIAKYVSISQTAIKVCGGLMIDFNFIKKIGFSDREIQSIMDRASKIETKYPPYRPAIGPWCESVYDQYGSNSDTMPLLVKIDK